MTEAIFTNGVLKPTERLDLRENERVRIVIESTETASPDRHKAIEAFRKGQSKMNFVSGEPASL